MALFTKLDDIFAPEISSDQNRYTTIFEEAFNVIKAHTHASGDGQPPVIADGSVTESKIATGAVTNAKLGESSVAASKLASDAVETVKIKDLNVTSAKIAAKAITHEKLADVTFVETESFSYNFPYDMNPHDVVSITLTSTGRPIEFCLREGYIYYVGSDTDPHSVTFQLYRDGASIESTKIGGTGRTYAPAASINFIDKAPSVGEHTYKIVITQEYLGTGGVVAKLSTREL